MRTDSKHRGPTRIGYDPFTNQSAVVFAAITAVCIIIAVLLMLAN